MGSAHSVLATMGLSPLTACSFMVYTAQAPRCSAGELCKLGPWLHALPRSKLLRIRFSGTPQRRRLCWACVLCRSQVRAAQATRCLVSALSLSGSCVLSPPGPSPLVSRVAAKAPVSGMLCVSSGELISGCNPPGRCQPSRIPRSLGWQLGACLQFAEDASLGPRTLDDPAGLPASGGGWSSLQSACSPLVFA